MEDSSLSESEVENKGTSGRNEPAGMPIASSAGFSPSSEVHIVSFAGFFIPACGPPPFPFLSFFHFCALAWDSFKMPPSSSSLSL